MATKKTKTLRRRPTLAEGARTIGIDPSLTNTGIAVFDDVTGWRLGSVSTGATGPSMRELFGRLDAIRDGVLEVIGGFRPDDLVVIEGYMILAQGASRGPIIANWHHIVGSIVDAGLEPEVVAPASRATYATGGGAGGKDRVMSNAYRRFPEANVETNDEADAMFLAALGRHLAGRSIEPAPLPQSHLTIEKHYEPVPEPVVG